MTVLVADRLIPALGPSLMRFLKDMVYAVRTPTGQVQGTLIQQFRTLALVPAYPDDLSALTLPTLAIQVPTSFETQAVLFGEDAQEQAILVDLFGFVVKQGKDMPSKQYRDRLLSDVVWLFDRIGRNDGITLYDEDKTVLGQIEVTRVRGRLLPPVNDRLEGERYKFHVAVDLQYDSGSVEAEDA